jgi:RNA polymerase sigma-70 factor (ECF subfamily)
VQDLDIESLFLDYADDVYSYIAFLTHSTDVEDLVQETFLKALQGLPQFRGTANVKTWLFSIARNVVRDEYRRRRRRIVGDPFKLHEVPSASPTPEGFAELNEAKRQLLQVIQRLKPSHRDVVILRIFMEMSAGEAADTLGWSESRVNVTLHRAIRKIRKQLPSEQVGGGVRSETISR